MGLAIAAYEIAYCFSRRQRCGGCAGGADGLPSGASGDAGGYGAGHTIPGADANANGCRRYADAGADCYCYLGPANSDAVPYSDADGNAATDADAYGDADAIADAGRPVANRCAGYQGASLG